MPIINNINELNERITIVSISANAGPDPGETETELFSCWAKIRTQTISDVKALSGTDFANTIDIVIRQQQQAEINNTMLVKWRGKKYPIVKINPDYAKKEFMVLVCKLVS